MRLGVTIFVGGLSMTARVTVDPAHVSAHNGSGDVHVPAHERHVLDNGVTLISVPRRDVPLVAFNAIVAAYNREGNR